METTKDIINDAKRRVEEATKDHILTEEVNTPALKSYLFQKPNDCIYWMRAIQTNYGLHLEGDVGCLQICYKTFGWLASGDSIDYQMSKLDHAFSNKEEISPYLVKNLVENMIRSKWDNRSWWRDKSLAKQRKSSLYIKKVTLFTTEEREFFQDLKDYNYKPEWTLEHFYERVYDLKGWEDYCSDGLNITDYSWSIYFRFFCLKKVAQKIIELNKTREEQKKLVSPRLEELTPLADGEIDF